MDRGEHGARASRGFVPWSLYCVRKRNPSENGTQRCVALHVNVGKRRKINGPAGLYLLVCPDAAIPPRHNTHTTPTPHDTTRHVHRQTHTRRDPLTGLHHHPAPVHPASPTPSPLPPPVGRRLAAAVHESADTETCACSSVLSCRLLSSCCTLASAKLASRTRMHLALASAQLASAKLQCTKL